MEGERKKELKRKSLAYLPFGLLLLVGCYACYRFGLSSEAYQFQAQNYAQSEQRKATPRIVRECMGLQSIPFAKCADEVIEAGEQREREAYNLAAQQKVARTSEFVFGLGIFELALTLWGILVLRDQLIANQRATEAMIKANTITEEAAEKSLAETRRIGEAQVRCYVTGVSAKLGFTNDGEAVITFVAKNTGQSPARAVNCSGELWMSAADGEYVHFAESAIETKTRLDLASGVEEEFTIVLKVDLDKWLPSNEGMYFASLYVKILATDVFDKPAPETERFVAHCEQKPTTKGWTDMKRAARFT